MPQTPRRNVALCAVVVSAALLFAAKAAAQTGVEHFDSREAFGPASSGLTTIDFGAVAPARGFGKYRPEEGLTTGGVTLRASGGARFGPGWLYVVSAHYGGANPLYNTGTLPLLSWAVPNQPGNAALEVALPAGTTAFGADLWTQQPYASSVEVTATTADGRTQTVVVGTRNRPAASFVGFISDSPIVTVSFRPPKGQTGLLLDNITYGRKAAGRSIRASTPSAQGPADETTATVTTTPTAPSPVVAQTPTAQTSRPPVPAASQSTAPADGALTVAPRGTIAYIRGGTEIRLIEADGRDDRRLWTHPEAREGSPVYDLRWLPDGSGFLYAFPDLAYEFGNIFRYDFATKRVAQLTNFTGEYARGFDISPDGAWVVFERARSLRDDKDVDLWLMRADGSDARRSCAAASPRRGVERRRC